MKIYRVSAAEFPAPLRDSAHSLRVLSVDEIEELRERRAAGWKVQALMNAYGVSRRTVYRWVSGDVVSVQIGGWVAGFHILPGQSPQRLSSWRVADGRAA